MAKETIETEAEMTPAAFSQATVENLEARLKAMGLETRMCAELTTCGWNNADCPKLTSCNWN